MGRVATHFNLCKGHIFFSYPIYFYTLQLGLGQYVKMDYSLTFCVLFSYRLKMATYMSFGIYRLA